MCTHCRCSPKLKQYSDTFSLPSSLLLRGFRSPKEFRWNNDLQSSHCFPAHSPCFSECLNYFFIIQEDCLFILDQYRNLPRWSSLFVCIHHLYSWNNFRQKDTVEEEFLKTWNCSSPRWSIMVRCVFADVHISTRRRLLGFQNPIWAFIVLNINPEWVLWRSPLWLFQSPIQ